MSHGLPDFGQYAAKSTVYGLPDLGELAVRLGSVSTFDRRGDISWWDDFSGGPSIWLLSSSDGNGTKEQSNEYYRLGGYALKLTTPAYDASYSYVTRHLAYPVLSKIGAEFAFTIASAIRYYEIHIEVYTGSQWLSARARYDTSLKELQVRDVTTWTTVATGVTAYMSTSLFHYFKLVADFSSTLKYVRMIFNNREVDLSNYSLYSASSTRGAYLQVTFWITLSGAVAESSLLDSVIVTQNEP